MHMFGFESGLEAVLAMGRVQPIQVMLCVCVCVLCCIQPIRYVRRIELIEVLLSFDSTSDALSVNPLDALSFNPSR